MNFFTGNNNENIYFATTFWQPGISKFDPKLIITDLSTLFSRKCRNPENKIPHFFSGWWNKEMHCCIFSVIAVKICSVIPTIQIEVIWHFAVEQPCRLMRAEWVSLPLEIATLASENCEVKAVIPSVIGSPGTRGRTGNAVLGFASVYGAQPFHHPLSKDCIRQRRSASTWSDQKMIERSKYPGRLWTEKKGRGLQCRLTESS